MKSMYSVGANFERRVVKEFLLQGASWAVRTAGSHSPIDVVAFFDKHVIACQCQISPPFSAGKKEALLEAIRNKDYAVGYLVWRYKREICMEQVY